MRAYELSLATSGALAAVAWHGGRSEHNEIYLQWLAEADAGSPRGEPLQVTHGREESYEPDLQLAGGSPVLGWYDKDPASGFTRAWLARLDPQGRELWRRPLSAQAGAARNPVVRIGANGISVAWIEKAAAGTTAVWAARYGLDGVRLAGLVAAGAADANTWNLNAALDAQGVFHVVYDASLGTRHQEMQLAVVSAGGVRHLPLSADGVETVYPDLRISERGDVALTWFDRQGDEERVFFSLLDRNALTGGGKPAWRPVSAVRSSSFGSYLAWNGQRIGIAWCDKRSGTTQLYARSFDSAGNALGEERLLSEPGATAAVPSVQPWGAGFLVAWNEYRVAAGPGHGRVLSSVARTAYLK